MTDLNQLKESVYQANMALTASGLVLFTFGNVSPMNCLIITSLRPTNTTLP